ncbi:putative F-box/FBD/LRR-repeat protein At1g22000 [Eutrema salsugineum]|uniref:putative F-box/FBD/LRR-repeat protein At1g22000 n=1 Tax=Eutrema salsugineum TaxID=72664 RepID=UPI000CECE882|nr:putative F-box/FBD/LRR-repeat protein At1g22000 [Eutrema salsugineum]
MLKPLLLYFGLVHVGFEIALLLEQAIPILLEQTKQTSRRFFKKRAKRYEGEDRISALPDDLLVRILSLVPTKDAVPTMILSKRWRSIWTMVPALQYLEINNGTRGIVIAGLLGRLLDRLFGKSDQKPRCIWRFIDGSLQHHKAHVLETLAILIGGHCPVNTDVGKWIVNAVDRRVRELSFFLSWSAEPTRLPTCLYTCDTLVSMGLYDKVLVDVPSPACFPSLKALGLYHVLYKDEDSIVRFLSSCPILKHLAVHRHYYDNVKRFKIKVPSLEIFWYECTGYKNIEGTLVIDSPALKKLFITYNSAGFCLIENKPRFEKATINVDCYLDNKFMRSISSLKYLELHLNFATVACCDAINFSKLMECKLTLANELDWLDPLMRLLGNSPNLKVVSIDQVCTFSLMQHAIDLRRISHFHGTNRVLFRDVCQPISRSLSGEDIEEVEEIKKSLDTFLPTPSV